MAARAGGADRGGHEPAALDARRAVQPPAVPHRHGRRAARFPARLGALPARGARPQGDRRRRAACAGREARALVGALCARPHAAARRRRRRQGLREQRRVPRLFAFALQGGAHPHRRARVLAQALARLSPHVRAARAAGRCRRAARASGAVRGGAGARARPRRLVRLPRHGHLLGGRPHAARALRLDEAAAARAPAGGLRARVGAAARRRARVAAVGLERARARRQGLRGDQPARRAAGGGAAARADAVARAGGQRAVPHAAAAGAGRRLRGQGPEGRAGHLPLRAAQGRGGALRRAAARAARGGRGGRAGRRRLRREARSARGHRGVPRHVDVDERQQWLRRGWRRG